MEACIGFTVPSAAKRNLLRSTATKCSPCSYLSITASACTAFGVAASRSLSTAAVSRVMVFMLGASTIHWRVFNSQFYLNCWETQELVGRY